MINRKTVLVLGAGASKPYGFPTGAELIAEIGTGLQNASNVTFHQLQDAGFDCQQIKKLATELQGSQLYSIDEFLEHRPELVPVGKGAIAGLLLPRELKSNESLFDLNKSDHWYRHLRNSLRSSFEAFKSNQLRVISFNYDRSFEHYLFESVRSTYGRGPHECAEITGTIDVIHVYGSLGPLPWQTDSHDSTPESKAVPYGSEPLTSHVIKKASDSIRVLHEKDEEVRTRLETVRSWLQWGERIFFLGFGFHPDNVRRLSLRGLRREQEPKGTCLGLSLELREQAVSCTHWAAPKVVGSVYAIEFPDPKADCYTFLHDHVTLS